MATMTASTAGVLGIALSLGALAGGCQNGDEFEIRPLDIEAVTAPDSVLPGQAIEVKVHWHVYLERLLPAEFIAIDDTTFRLELSVKVPTNLRNPPLIPVSPYQTVHVLTASPDHDFHLQVVGSREYDLPVSVGAAPAEVERHRLFVTLGEASEPIEGASVAILDSDQLDTLALFDTGPDGTGETTLSCEGTPRPYALLITSDHGSVWLESAISPARCGVPERTVVRF
jgi:hypothetical protein